MSKHHTQYTYNQPIYSNPKSNQNINYGTYQATNYQQTKHTKSQKKVVYQEQVIEQPQTEYIVEGNTYPQTQYIQGNEYIIQDQGITYQNPKTGEITGYEQQIYQPGQQVIYQDQKGQQVIYQDQPGQQVIYQDQQGQQFVYQDQLQPGEQIIYQEQQPGEQIIYTDEQGQPIIYQDQQGQQIYYQEQQQPVEQVIYQDQYNQQIYEQNPQTVQEQRKAKYTKQMVSNKPNMKQKQPYQQQEFVSRNPHMKQQNLNIPQQYNQNISGQKYNPQPQRPIQNQQKQMIQQEKPMIESEFQPDFQVANSVLGLSQIPFDPNQIPKKENTPIQPKGPYQNPNQQNYIQPSYVVPRRNPNAKLTKYDITNSSHYVNTNDPGSRTSNSKVGNISNINQTQNSNKGINMKSKISEEQKPPMNYGVDPKLKEKEDQNQILNEEDKPEVGEGITCLGNSGITNNNSINNNINISNNYIKTNDSINNKSNINNNINVSSNNINNNINNKSNINNNSDINISNNNMINNINMIKSESITNSKGNSNINISNNNINNNINNTNMSSNVNMKNYNDNQMNPEEIEKENPIEEKVPDVSNMDNPNNIMGVQYEKYQPHFQAQEVHESKLKESVDIDDNLDHLPTVGSIMKGKSDMLPPPKKRKYDE